jgi:hypothetical protein
MTKWRRMMSLVVHPDSGTWVRTSDDNQPHQTPLGFPLAIVDVNKQRQIVDHSKRDDAPSFSGVKSRQEELNGLQRRCHQTALSQPDSRDGLEA